jgi:leader peptidase (prepilin peptidase) / N-methyltransferase
VAAQFGVLFFVELISGGANLSVRPTDYYAGVLWTVWYLKYPDLMQLYLFHGLLLYLSLALMLIAVDRQIAPVSLIAFGVVAGLVWLAIEPQLHPVLGLPRWGAPQGWPQHATAIWSGIRGITLGAGMGILLTMTHSRSDDAPEHVAIFGIFSLCGLYLGPSAVLSVAAISLLIYLAGRAAAFAFPGFNSIPLMVCSVLALHTQILFWRQLSAIPYWPCHAQAWNYHLQILLIVVVVVVAIRDWDQWLSPSRSS